MINAIYFLLGFIIGVAGSMLVISFSDWLYEHEELDELEDEEEDNDNGK